MSSILRILNITEQMMVHQQLMEGEPGRKLRMIREGMLREVQTHTAALGLWPCYPEHAPQMYRHWRNGKAYVRLSPVLDTRDDRLRDLYLPLYPADHAAFVRDRDEFDGEVEVAGGGRVPRFTLVRD